MAANRWDWAELNSAQLSMLLEGEQSLGADILLAYQQAGAGAVQADQFSQNNLRLAALNDSQLECLQGLEKNMQAVVIAYQQA
jgi:hypothetical protein